MPPAVCSCDKTCQRRAWKQHKSHCKPAQASGSSTPAVDSCQLNSTGEVLSSHLADKVNAEYAAAAVGSAIRIQARQGQGLCVVAARPIEANEVFLTEAPLLVADITESHDGYLKAFCSAPADTQAAVLSLFSVSLENKSALVKEARKAAKKHVSKQWASGQTIDTLHRALLVFALNSHCFSTVGGTSAPQSALLQFGARMNHSCDSNCEYTSDRVPGFGCHVAVRPIAEGELITANYLGDDALMSTTMRRYILSEQKLFHCECSRCLLPDLTRAAPCPGCQSIRPNQFQIEGFDALSGSILHYAAPFDISQERWRSNPNPNLSCIFQ